MGLMDTPRGGRLHIGVFGKRNSGKSSLVNALTGQEAALVSDVAGTTTDPVYKAMELHGIGPVVFIDTAGFDDEGALGELRVKKTEDAAKETDIALLLFADDDMAEELRRLEDFRRAGTAVIAVVSRADEKADGGKNLAAAVEKRANLRPIIAGHPVPSMEEGWLAALRAEIIRALPEDYEAASITGNLCARDDLVLLVMPQDIQAPKGRLILPQVQTLRELLDKKCTTLCCTTDEMENALAALARPPKLIITDSQAFREVHEKKPAASKLTSFSVLFANYKGDLAYFLQSARKMGNLSPDARILIAEACTHRPLTEDIGRVKLPRLLKKRFGGSLRIEIVSGRDFPRDLTGYDFIIHCGACMFNRRYVLSRVEEARRAHVPMSNYGVTLAWLMNILENIDYPS